MVLAMIHKSEDEVYYIGVVGLVMTWYNQGFCLIAVSSDRWL